MDGFREAPIYDSLVEDFEVRRQKRLVDTLDQAMGAHALIEDVSNIPLISTKSFLFSPWVIDNINAAIVRGQSDIDGMTFVHYVESHKSVIDSREYMRIFTRVKYWENGQDRA